MRKGVFILVLVCFTFLASGCFLTDKLASLKEGFNKGKAESVETGTDMPTVVIDPQDTAPLISGETKTVVLYFADTATNRLAAEERTIAKVTGIARATMQELIKGPNTAGLAATLPATTQLLDINVKPDGLAIVDFSGELIDDLTPSKTAEELALYSIVNTLCQYPTIERVEIRVNGHKVNTLLGYTKFNDDLVMNTSLIK